MKVFLAGATGAIGRRLVPLLVDAGHEVAGMTRTTGNVASLSRSGAVPVVCDVFDANALQQAVSDFAPDLVMHQLTDLPDDPARIAEFGAANGRIRREGTKNLLAAAKAVGAGRFVAQSVAWELPGDGAAAVADHESMVLGAGGLVLRYGRFHGPGTYHESDLPPPPRVHVDEAAARTLEVMTAESGVVTIIGR